jgi:hypothetical protein
MAQNCGSGSLSAEKLDALDEALRIALDIPASAS